MGDDEFAEQAQGRAEEARSRGDEDAATTYERAATAAEQGAGRPGLVNRVIGGDEGGFADRARQRSERAKREGDPIAGEAFEEAAETAESTGGSSVPMVPIGGPIVGWLLLLLLLTVVAVVAVTVAATVVVTVVPMMTAWLVPMSAAFPEFSALEAPFWDALVAPHLTLAVLLLAWIIRRVGGSGSLGEVYRGDVRAFDGLVVGFLLGLSAASAGLTAWTYGAGAPLPATGRRLVGGLVGAGAVGGLCLGAVASADRRRDGRLFADGLTARLWRSVLLLPVTTLLFSTVPLEATVAGPAPVGDGGAVTAGAVLAVGVAVVGVGLLARESVARLCRDGLAILLLFVPWLLATVGPTLVALTLVGTALGGALLLTADIHILLGARRGGNARALGG